MLSVYLTLSYDCNYSEANNNQTEACATIRNAQDIPRIGTAFFRRRKDHKVCDQITAVCHNCSDISLCGCLRTRRIPSAGPGLEATGFIHTLHSWLLGDQPGDHSRFSGFLVGLSLCV